MTRKLTVFTAIAVFLLLFCPFLSAENIYTTGLNLKKSGKQILLEWKANTNKMTFVIYRSPSFPIANMLSMSNSLRLDSVSLDGVPDKDLFKFPPYVDKVSEDGKYYYLVIPDNKKITPDDFYPNLNYNISPVTFKSEEAGNIDELGPLVIMEQEEIAPPAPVVETASASVKSVFIKTNLGVFQVFWDMDQAGGNSVKFSVYRTTRPVTNAFDLNRIQPLKTVQDEYYLEDASVQTGVTYFYTIIANDYKIILPGRNQNVLPAFLGNTNAGDIQVEREVYRKVKVNTRNFNARFKK